MRDNNNNKNPPQKKRKWWNKKTNNNSKTLNRKHNKNMSNTEYREGEDERNIYTNIFIWKYSYRLIHIWWLCLSLLSLSLSRYVFYSLTLSLCAILE